MRVVKFITGLMLGLACITQARGEAMLQLFNVSWDELSQKMPELAEAGYTSLWLPPPTKGSGGLSVGYDLHDPFDLGDKDQKGTIRTRYGTKDELLRMMEMAHRFGMRVYFDNIMNHRAFEVPGYNEFTPITVYPGMLPEDFHLRVTPDGFFRKWDNTRDWNSTWQVQNLGLADLIDISQENPNANFGLSEGTSGNPKLSFVRDPNNPERYDFHPTLGRVGFGKVTQADLDNNPTFYKEDIGGYLTRAVRWLMNETKADGLRLDAVKHVPSYFFGKQSGADKDTSDDGYCGQIQRQFNITHGFTDANHRNSNFDAEAFRDDALVFGEHLGEPPGYGEYIDAGMRLVDNPLRNYLNDVLGNGWRTLAGLDQRDFGGFSSSVRVMHAQSHDSDYASRRELQNALYFMKEGIANIYSDAYNKSQTCRDCGGAFPRHANAPYLGQFGDNKMPDLMYLHHQLARGGTRTRWSDSDIVCFERYDYREPGSAADQTVVLFCINDNYGFPGDTAFVDGEGETFPSNTNVPPGANNNRQGLAVQFPVGSVLYQLADPPGKERAYSPATVRLASNDRAWVKLDPANRIYVGNQPVPAGGGGIEILIPSGGYVMYAYQPPQASRPSGVMSNNVVTLRQNGVDAPRMTVRRTDGYDGDTAFNPIYPFKMRGSIDVSGNVIGGQNVSNLTYAIDIPVITNTTPFDVIVRTDASAANILVKLDGGMDLNSHMGLGPTTGFDKRDNKPGAAYDMFLGYEQPAFQSRTGPEKFAARNTNRNTIVSAGAETYQYTVGGGTNVVNGSGPNLNTETATWVYHDPADGITATGPHPSTQRSPLEPGSGQSVEIWVKVGFSGQINKCFIYYTTDGSNPEGAFGVGRGTTQVVEAFFTAAEPPPNASIDWWKGTIPARSSGTVKYKIALYKTGIAAISDADTAKLYGRTQFAITNFNPLTATVWLHSNLNTNHTATGLQEGYHIVRARAFLPRDGKSSVFNTFLQTFYYDPTPPTGVIAFPQSNGDFLFSKEYGVVVRGDATVTEVEYNIIDSEPSNDDIVTGFPNGNGLSNGVPVFARANLVSPLPSLSETYPNLPKEYRFGYVAVPSSGGATITVRLKELTSATFSNRITTLTRTVNCAAPPQFVEIAFPSFNGQNIFLDQNDQYTIVARFTETLTANIDLFTIKIDGAVQARRRSDGTPLYRFEDHLPGDGKNELRFDWTGMSSGQHIIEVTYNDGTLNLQASRVVNVTLTGVSVNIINPPDADAAGRSPFTIVLSEKTNAVPSERSFVITTETSLSVTNVNIGFNANTNSFAGGVASNDTTFVGTTLRWNFTWTNMVAGTFVIRADAVGTEGSNTAFRTVNVVFRDVVMANPDRDDDDDDGLSDIDESVLVPLPSTNPENWSNGEVHKYFYSGHTDPLTPDTDGDGLPDALELGLEGIIATSTVPGTDTNGDGFPNFIADADPPRYNTTDNSGITGFDLNKSRTDLIRGSVTDPTNPDTDYDSLNDGIEDANRNGRVDIGLTNSAGVVTSVIQFPPTVRATSRVDRSGLPLNSVFLETDPNNSDTDEDGLPDGTEDANRNGIVDIGLVNSSGVVTGVLANPPTISFTGMKSRAIDRTSLYAQYPNAVWLETDPLNRDTDGDGLPDGWEVQYGLDPLDNGTTNFGTGGAGNPINGANGDPDGDGLNNLTEFNNGTNPRENDNLPPPPANSVIIGAGPVIGTTGGVTWNQEFQDWKLDDLKALDEYDGNGFLKRGRDIYPWNDGFDSSRDIVAFYARDGGADGKFYFRVDLHELQYNAEKTSVDIYIVIDTGNPSVGEAALPDDVDAKTDMKWEVVVAAYDGNNGRVYVDVDKTKATTGINQDLVAVGGVQVRGYTPGSGNGFIGSYYRSDLDAVEIAISRQALTDAGWNGNAANLNFQVFTTRDGTQNSPRGAGDIGGRPDITDSIMDDEIAESDTQLPQNTLTQWFNFNNRPNYAKVAVVLHGNQAILPASIIQTLVSNSVQRTPANIAGSLDPGNNPTGYFRGLETARTFGIPLNLHLSGSLISALQWAKSDPALDPTGSRDGVRFNQQIASLVQSNGVSLVSGMFAEHIAPYFTGAVNRAGIQLQNEIMRAAYGQNSVSASTPLWLAERVVDGKTLSDLAVNSGHNYLLLDQMVHLWWWAEQLYGFGNGRLTALGTSGYQINQFNGMKVFLISGASDQMYLNNDLGSSMALRELMHRKAMSGNRDQIIILADNWEDAGGVGGRNNPDKLNLNLRWIANHPWIKIVRLDEFTSGQMDLNNDGQINGNDFPFVQDRGTANFSMQAKDLIRHNTRTNYNNWYYGMTGAEESFYDKFPPIRTGILANKKMGHVLTNGTILADAWFNTQAATGTLSNLAKLVYLNGIFETAFHDEDNNDASRFSTGDYKFPDITNPTGFPHDPLSAFAYKPNSRATRQASIVAHAATWAASSPATTAVTAQQDVDHDGENEYVLSNNRIYAVFEGGPSGKSMGGRLIAAFARDPVTGAAYQMVGNMVSTPEFETEDEGNANVSGSLPLAYRTSGLKDWFAITNAVSGAGTAQYVNDLYNVAAAPSGTGWQFTSSDGKIVKTVRLSSGDSKLEAGYTLGGGVTKLFVRHGLSPDLMNLLFQGQAGLQGPTSTGGKLTLTNTTSPGSAAISVNFADAGHTNVNYNSLATDRTAGFVSVNLRNQAQTQQIELESTAGHFSFALEMNATDCTADTDGDGLTNCDELNIYGTNPNNPDSDGDGMPDGWEVANSLNPLVNDANVDPDGDGQDNYGEFRSGTNPQNAADYLRIVNITQVGASCQIVWTSVPGKNYEVWATTDVTNPASYARISGSTPIPASGSPATTTSFMDSSSPGVRKFYKVKVL